MIYVALEAVVATLLLAAAAAIFAAAPSRRQNRLLALVLLVDAAAHLGSGLGNAAEAGVFAARTEFGAARLFAVATAAVPFLYLLFLGTIETRAAAPLRRPVVAVALGALALAAAAAPLVFRDVFVPVVDGGPTAGTLAMVVVFLGWGLVSVLGLVLAVLAWRQAAPGTPARRKAGIFAVAFGVRDVIFAVFGAVVVLGTRIPGLFEVSGWLPPLADLLFVPLLAYGVLRFQVLDVDLKLKWTVQRGTLAAAFGATFFVVAQLVQNVASTTLGVVGGATAAGLLLFAIQPLQRAADRVADVALPRVAATPEYLASRRLEVYRAAVESAIEEGGIDAKERAILDRLQAKLGLPRQDATRVEAAVLAT